MLEFEFIAEIREGQSGFVGISREGGRYMVAVSEIPAGRDFIGIYEFAAMRLEQMAAAREAGR